MDARGRSYSDVGSRFAFKLASNVACAGTAAAITAVDGTQWRVNFNCKVVGISAYIKTGGTAAGPVILLQRSLAGTGAYASIGTITIGTKADATGVAGAVTETDLLAGDFLQLAVGAGTAASTPTISAFLDLIENFVSVTA
jgi:hypothetical protein